MDGLFGIDWDLDGEVDITDDIITFNLLEDADKEKEENNNKERFD
jgi:hypothetical protein